MSAHKNQLAATVIGSRPQSMKGVVISRALMSTSTPKEALIHLMHIGQHHNVNISDVLVGGFEDASETATWVLDRNTTESTDGVHARAVRECAY
jgi:hypothetical protein